MEIKTAYPIGGFTGWRDGVINYFPNIEFNDPRDHDQASICKLDYQDLGAAATSDLPLVNVPENGRVGTMSYVEIGTAYAAGKPITLLDPYFANDEFLNNVKSYDVSCLKELESLINTGEIVAKNLPLYIYNKTQNDNPCKSVMFVGDYCNEVSALEEECANSGKNIVKSAIEVSRDFALKTDLLVANFSPGKKHQPETLYFMGVAHQVGVPIIMLEGNPVPYPPLLGLARRVLVGEKRFEQAEEYLKNLGSQHITDEAKVYYKLMEKFN